MRDPDVIRPERLLPDREGSPVERLRLVGMALGVAREREGVQAVGDGSVARAEGGLAHRQPLARGLLGVGEPPLHPVHLGEVVQADAEAAVRRRE